MDTLFDLHDFSEKRICATGGKEFLPSQKQRKFCCPKCKRVFFQRKEAARITARYESIQGNEVPLPANLSDRVKEAVKLYLGIGRKKRLGIRAIANLQDVSHVQIRRDLIEAGVYKPTPEQNRRSRKGTGSHSRVRKREMSEERKKEWERKVNVCLEKLKQGIGVETTCHTNGWTPAGVWFHLYRNDEYKKWKAAHPAKPANVKQYERSRLFDWRSKKYPREEEFQDTIEQFLKDFHIAYVREKKLKDYQSRMDFELYASTFLECKTCTKSNIFMRAIGQALIAQGESKSVWIVIPDDIKVRPDQQTLLEKNHILLLKESEFREKLANQKLFVIQLTTIADTGLVV